MIIDISADFREHWTVSVKEYSSLFRRYLENLWTLLHDLKLMSIAKQTEKWLKMLWSFLSDSPKTKHDVVAVNILEAVNNSAWSKLNALLGCIANPTPSENMETINAATVACTWTKAMFPTTMCMISLPDTMFPKFACVQRRDASVMSKFPFSPSKAGTRMNSSGIAKKTSQCYRDR